MKNLILIIAIIFSGMLMQAQKPMKGASKIIIHTSHDNKSEALENFMEYLIDSDIYFMDVNLDRGIIKSERFSSFGMGNWETMSSIMVIAKEKDQVMTLTIMGNTLQPNNVEVKMINKHFMGNVGGVMFDQINKIAENYSNGELVSYSK